MEQIKKIWEGFAEIPINSEDQNEVDFIGGKEEFTDLMFGIGLMESLKR